MQQDTFSNNDSEIVIQYCEAIKGSEANRFYPLYEGEVVTAADQK